MEKIGTFGYKDVVLVDDEAVCDCGVVTHYRIHDPSTNEMWVCCSICLQGVMDENERRRHAQAGMQNCLTVAISLVLVFIVILILAYLGKI
jgi:hypothetical protein